MERSDIETGTVLKTDGMWATVITNKSKSCRECGKAQAGICGKSGSGIVMKVKNPAGAKIWDTVLLDIDTAVKIRAYLITFILPVAALFAGTYAGSVISGVTGYGGAEVIGGLLGLAISFIYSFNRIRSIDRSHQLQITRVLHAPPHDELPSGQEGSDYLNVFSRSH